MYNSNDFLTMLQSGKNPEDIANEFTKALNEAIQEQKSKEAEAQAQEKKVSELVAILKSVNGYMAKFYPDLARHMSIPEDTMTEIAETLVDYIDETSDELVQELDAIQKVAAMFDKYAASPAPKVKDPIATFLKDNHLS